LGGEGLFLKKEVIDVPGRSKEKKTYPLNGRGKRELAETPGGRRGNQGEELDSCKRAFNH